MTCLKSINFFSILFQYQPIVSLLACQVTCTCVYPSWICMILYMCILRILSLGLKGVRDWLQQRFSSMDTFILARRGNNDQKKHSALQGVITPETIPPFVIPGMPKPTTSKSAYELNNNDSDGPELPRSQSCFDYCYTKVDMDMSLWDPLYLALDRLGFRTIRSVSKCTASHRVSGCPGREELLTSYQLCLFQKLIEKTLHFGLLTGILGLHWYCQV